MTVQRYGTAEGCFPWRVPDGRRRRRKDAVVESKLGVLEASPLILESPLQGDGNMKGDGGFRRGQPMLPRLLSVKDADVSATTDDDVHRISGSVRKARGGCSFIIYC